jgi:hypothetical protein
MFERNMKAVIRNNLFFLIVMFLYGGCAEKMPENNKLNLTINVVKSYSWINLMPGGEPSFHLLCEIRIKNNSDVPVENLKLQQVSMFDDTLEILKFKPLFVNRKIKSDMSLLPNEAKDFSISAPDKINIAKLKDNNVISLLLNFSSEGKTLEYKIDSVKIDRVY